jgi:chaperone modulatory protein CbpM
MRLTVEQVTAELRLDDERELLGWIEQSWVLPLRGDQGYVFDEVDLARVRLIREMRLDLSIDEDAIPVILSLLDQVYGLRRAMRGLQEAIDSAPADARNAILRQLKNTR